MGLQWTRHTLLAKVKRQQWTGQLSHITRTCLNQLLIAIRLSVILCNHTRSKTRLITIMNLIATQGIIYISLHNHALSEYQLSLPYHRAWYVGTTYKQDTGRGVRWGVVSQLQQQPALCLCSVLCWPPSFLSSPARQSSLTAAHWPTYSHKHTEHRGVRANTWLQGD